MDGPTLAFAGRLMAAKALDVAFAALELVPGVALVIVGDGPDRAALEQQRDALDLGSRVRFLGGLSREVSFASSGRPTPSSSPLAGRTSRTSSSRRSPSGRR